MNCEIKQKRKLQSTQFYFYEKSYLIGKIEETE